MQARRLTFICLQALALCALLALAAHLLAQPGPVVASDVRVYPIPDPDIDSGIPLADPAAAAVTVPSAPGAWGGARTGAEATLSDRVVNYAIDATLDPLKHTVSGRQKLTWRNRSRVQARSVFLHLYMNAFESRASTFFTEQRHSGMAFRSGVATGDGQWGHIELRSVAQNGAKVGWAFVHPDLGPETDHTVVRLDLPVPVEGGASTTLDIDFLTQLPRVSARTGYFGSFHLVGQWFPKIGVLELPGERGATAVRWNAHEFHADSEFYADFGNYDVKLTVPAGYTVGATGALQGAPVAHEGMVTHHYVQGDVHDFAWTADKRSAAPLVGNWTGAGGQAVAIRVLYPPEMAASAAASMKAARDSLDYFSRTLGPYPYATLTVVIPPYNAMEAAGMEYPTFITAMGVAHLAPDTMGQFEVDFTTIHEFGHGYFYGILASNEFEEPLLDEGLNEFWDHRMVGERDQRVHVAPAWLARLGLAPAFASFDLVRAGMPRTEPADPPGQNAYDRLQGIGPVYARSAIVLRDLEQRIGKPAMERAMRAYYQRWKFRHPSVADLREALAEASGQRAAVESVFAQQIYATAAVDDRVDRFSSAEELPQPGTAQVGGKWIETTQDQLEDSIDATRAAWKKAHPRADTKTGPFPYRTAVTVRRRGAAVPQVLLVKFADGSSEQVAFNPGPGMHEHWQTFTWLTPSHAVSAELDPARQHYLDADKLDDSSTIDPDARAARRWTGDLGAIVNLLFSLIATI